MFNVDDINMIPNNSLVRFRGMVCAPTSPPDSCSWLACPPRPSAPFGRSEPLPRATTRCRTAQVQDMFNPEIFIGAFKEPGAAWQTCKYQDFMPTGPSEAAETVVSPLSPSSLPSVALP